MSIAVLLLFTIASLLALGLYLNRRWFSDAGPYGGISRDHRLPSCGQCGYAVRGIETLACPECGADLREVGIIMPGQANGFSYGCLLIPLSAILTIVVAALLYQPITDALPDYADESVSVSLNSSSGGIRRAEVHIEYLMRVPKGQAHNTMSNGYSSSTSYSSSPSGRAQSSNISFSGTMPRPNEIQSLYAEIQPNTPSVAYRPVRIDVDPITMHANWTDMQGNTTSINRPLTEQDVIGMFNHAGADTTRQEVVTEAKELHAVLNGLANGMSQFSFTGLMVGSSSSGGSYSDAPRWFSPAYFVGWVFFWIACVVYLARKASKKSAA
ncbi:MAG: hypothetical protein AAGC72_15305 [Planctomycetota bacterium]